jgi:hypothetical protein
MEPATHAAVIERTATYSHQFRHRNLAQALGATATWLIENDPTGATVSTVFVNRDYGRNDWCVRLNVRDAEVPA